MLMILFKQFFETLEVMYSYASCPTELQSYFVISFEMKANVLTKAQCVLELIM